MSTKTEQMGEIRKRVIGLRNSLLAQERRKGGWLPVIGEGSHDAKIMFIGEAPGKNEAEQGRPFCGASGRVLDELLASVGIAREDVYVTNVVKDRPPANRDPLPDDIAIYAPLLKRQIEIIQPKVLAALGRFSMEWLMRTYGLESEIEGISKIHGRVFQAKTKYGDVIIIPLFHPAVALYNGNRKVTLIEDFKQLQRYI